MKRSANHFVLSGLLVLTLLVVSIGAGVVSAPDKALAQVAQHNPAIRLTPTESKILHLNENAASVVIANPRHASVFLDTPRILVIVPGAPGATSFTVLDTEGKEIMQRDVIVSERQQRYVRIQRVCADSNNCEPRSVYFCPDGCHQVVTSDGSEDFSPNPSGSSSAGAAGVSGGVPEIDYEGEEETGDE